MPFVERDGGRLFYEVIDLVPSWRRRDTILFHHGIAATREIWNGWIPALCERYRILRFDTRGFGESALAGPYRYSMAGLVEDALAVAAAGAAERFHFVGESLGGTVGLATALAAPEHVLSLTVSNAAHRGAGIVNVRSWREDIARRGRPGWARHMTESRLFPGAVDAESRDWFYQQLVTCSADAMLSLADLLLSVGRQHQQANAAERPQIHLCDPECAASYRADQGSIAESQTTAAGQPFGAVPGGEDRARYRILDRQTDCGLLRWGES